MSEKKTCVERIWSGSLSRHSHLCGKPCVNGSDRCKIHTKPSEKDHFPVYRVNAYRLEIIEHTMAGETDQFWIEKDGSRTAKYGQSSYVWKRTRAAAIADALRKAEIVAEKAKQEYERASERAEGLRKMSEEEADR